MIRFIPKFVLGLKKVTGSISVCGGFKTRIFTRYISQTSNRYKPVKLSYKLFEPECGSDDKLSPLIFLHGIISSKEATWGDLPQVFADQTKRKAYSLDARNHGDSEWSDEFDFDLNAEDLLHFIDEKGLSKVVIIAHSMGGHTGIKAALKVKLSNKIRAREKIFYPLGKDSSGRYVFKINHEVLFKKARNADAMMSENEGTYEGPSVFLYATKSFCQIEKEKEHILMHFPKAAFIPFETSNHFIHKKYTDLFVETVVKFIKENEKNL